MSSTQKITTGDDYAFASSTPPHNIGYLEGPVVEACRRYGARRIFDLGCGNGALCDRLSSEGFQVVGCDPSSSGIEQAVKTVPAGKFLRMGVYDDPQSVGESAFDVVVSTEVIEHLFYPRMLPRFAKAILNPQGYLVISTPYHGYFKNLALSLFDKWDFHHTALSDGMHIKFWSRRTLTQLLDEEGFESVEFIGAGRLPYFWKSMVIVAKLR